MHKRRSRSSSVISPVLEALEGRIVLSSAASGLAQGTAEVASKPGHKASTQTTLAISPATLGSPITFNVSVRAAASAGSPTGTVNLIEAGHIIQQITLAPGSSTPGVSQATYTLNQQPGGSDAYFGKYKVTAQFIPSGSFTKSSTSKTFAITNPSYTTLAGGVQVATVVPGSGTAIQTGQTASVMYTGYLASNGHIFDDSVNDGGTPFNFTLGSGQVIPGFDAGVTGMQVGETRVVKIPAAQAYGATATGTIPANSTLIFVMTLESISNPASTSTTTS
jgi:hypothetical protein